MILHQSLLGLHPLGCAPRDRPPCFSASRDHPFWAASHNPAKLPCCLHKTLDVERTLLAEQPQVMPDDFTVQHHLGHKGNASVNK